MNVRGSGNSLPSWPGSSMCSAFFHSDAASRTCLKPPNRMTRSSQRYPEKPWTFASAP